MGRRFFAIFGILFLMSGCNLIPDRPRIDFGKVYVGTPSTTQTATFSNNHATRPADVVGYSAGAPFSVTGTPGLIAQNGGTGSPVTITFLPTAVGAASGEVRPGVGNPMEIQVTALDLRGEGVYAKNEGTFSLENRPLTTVGPHTFGSSPITAGQPIDWGTRKLNNPATDAELRIRNAGAHVQAATAALRRGGQNFEVTSPSSSPFDIFQNTTRNVTVTFTPRAIGEFWDIVEVWDSAAPANKAGILLKAKVTESGE